MKQIEEATLLGTQAARDFLAATLRQSHELLANDERFNDENIVAFEEARDLRANGSQAAVLNFDEPVAAHRIDAKSSDPLLNAGLWPSVERLELAMEGRFHAAGVVT